MARYGHVCLQQLSDTGHITSGQVRSGHVMSRHVASSHYHVVVHGSQSRDMLQTMERGYVLDRRGCGCMCVQVCMVFACVCVHVCLHVSLQLAMKRV